MRLTRAEVQANDVLYLPYPDFRESARSLRELDLVHSAHTAEAVWGMEEKYRESFDSFGPSSGDLKWDDAVWWKLPRMKYVWAQWREFPAALALYGYELHAALGQQRAHSRRGWSQKVLVTWRARVDEQLHTGARWSATLGRKWKNQIDWLGDCRLHDSHKSELLRKQQSWYRQYGWGSSGDKLFVPRAAWYFARDCTRSHQARKEETARIRRLKYLETQEKRKEANGN